MDAGPQAELSRPAPDGLTEENDDDLDDDGEISFEELSRAAMAAGALDDVETEDEAEVARLLSLGLDPYRDPDAE